MISRNDFVGHSIFDFGELQPNDPRPVNNVIVKTDNANLLWVEETTKIIGDWRSKFRSTYISWALTINGLNVANKKYSDADWIDNHAFKIDSLRFVGNNAQLTPIAMWGSDKVADAHLKPLNMINSYGVIDLYSCIEEFIFDFYRIYWWGNPQDLIKGPDYKVLRKLLTKKDNDEEAMKDWLVAFNERLDGWQRKRLYDGLHRVFKAYCAHTGIQRPSWYIHTGIDTWAETIEGISVLRNCLTHGQTHVTKDLAAFSRQVNAMSFDFNEGEEITVKLVHLMGVESFCDSLLTALNASLFELVHGPSQKLRAMLN